MNKSFLMGRLTKDPSVRYTQGNETMCVARFTIAVDRRQKNDKDQADFISCVAFGKKGEFVEKYATKGMKFVVIGRIQTGSYEKDGRTIYTTDVVVEEIEFAESKKSGLTQESEDYMNVEDGLDADLPFN